MISFDREACRNLDSALQREWLETNGLGGFAFFDHHRIEHTPVSRIADRGYQAPSLAAQAQKWLPPRGTLP